MSETDKFVETKEVHKYVIHKNLASGAAERVAVYDGESPMELWKKTMDFMRQLKSQGEDTSKYVLHIIKTTTIVEKETLPFW